MLSRTAGTLSGLHPSAIKLRRRAAAATRTAAPPWPLPSKQSVAGRCEAPLRPNRVRQGIPLLQARILIARPRILSPSPPSTPRLSRRSLSRTVRSRARPATKQSARYRTRQKPGWRKGQNARPSEGEGAYFRYVTEPESRRQGRSLPFITSRCYSALCSSLINDRPSSIAFSFSGIKL